MKKSITILIILLFYFQISAQITAITELGDTIMVYQNGTWKKINQTLPPSFTEVHSAIPAFIGKTVNYPEGKALVPVKISSMLEYETLFGTFKPYNYRIKLKQDPATNKFEIMELGVDEDAEKQIMYYALDLYFKNGGGPCYIVPVPNLEDRNNLDIIRESDAYIKALAAISKIDEVTLLVSPDAVYLTSGYYDVYQEALAQCHSLKDRFAIFDVITTDQIQRSATNFRNGLVGDMKYGAAYMPYLNSNLSYGYNENQVTVIFEGVNNRGRIRNQISSETNSTSLNLLKNSNPKTYNFIKTELTKHNVILPPSAAIAGIYAQVDRDRGVWKAPANVAIKGIVGPTQELSQSEQEFLNVDASSGKSINPIKSLPGKGTLVWGARTLAGNDHEWRYISTRRLANLIEESAYKSTSFAVLEPNDSSTWLKAEALIDKYLLGLWRQGALAGSKPEQAYFVKVGLGKTMTSNDILQGKMIVEIGIATVRPAEFIIIRFEDNME